MALPLLVMIATGLLLQFKKQSDWVQPPLRMGALADPRISFDAILAAAREAPEAAISSWDDVDRLDVRPGKGVVKVRAKNHWEVQIDTSTGAVLQVAYRRSDLIESLHDGSWFAGDATKLGVFLPAAVILAVLWGSGLYLFLQPYLTRRRTRRARAR